MTFANHTQQNDRFGYIPFPFRAECGNYVIENLPDLDDRVTAVEKYSHRDGYFYPSEQVTYSVDPTSGEETQIPRTARPALLHRLPPTHTIALQDSTPLPQSFRNVLLPITSSGL
jgi:hypothetical protein